MITIEKCLNTLIGSLPHKGKGPIKRIQWAPLYGGDFLEGLRKGLEKFDSLEDDEALILHDADPIDQNGRRSWQVRILNLTEGFPFNKQGQKIINRTSRCCESLSSMGDIERLSIAVANEAWHQKFSMATFPQTWQPKTMYSHALHGTTCRTIGQGGIRILVPGGGLNQWDSYRNNFVTSNPTIIDIQLSLRHRCLSLPFVSCKFEQKPNKNKQYGEDLKLLADNWNDNKDTFKVTFKSTIKNPYALIPRRGSVEHFGKSLV